LDVEKMSAADFLFAPEVQKLLKVVYAAPGQQFSTGELARLSKLDPADAARTLAHLVDSGMLKKHRPKANAPDEEPEEPEETVQVDPSFVFHHELRSIALKSFAAAEPIRAMLRSRFKDSVVRAFLLGEDQDGTFELLVVHGQLTPDEAAMAAACRKLSKTLHRHLKVHVVSSTRLDNLAPRDPLGPKLSAPGVLELVALGDTKARLPAERIGFLQSAKKKLATLSRSPG
jgi:hypothetical protein